MGAPRFPGKIQRPERKKPPSPGGFKRLRFRDVVAILGGIVTVSRSLPTNPTLRMVMTNHNPNRPARPLAELALKNLIARDVAVLSAREADEETIWHDEARAKMRERALERAAANRKLKSQPAKSPGHNPGRTNYA